MQVVITLTWDEEYPIGTPVKYRRGIVLEVARYSADRHCEVMTRELNLPRLTSQAGLLEHIRAGLNVVLPQVELDNPEHIGRPGGPPA